MCAAITRHEGLLGVWGTSGRGQVARDGRTRLVEKAV